MPNANGTPEQNSATSTNGGEPTPGNSPEPEGAAEVTQLDREAPEQGEKLEESAEVEAPELDPASQLLSAQSQATANYEQFLRARAELDNVQKRQQRELSERAKYAAEPLARDLLAALDDLTRALDHHDRNQAENAESAAIAEGVRLVLTNLEATLLKHGVTRIESKGCQFDPNLHEAIAMVPSPDAEPGQVLEEHRAGYRLHDRLLRAALVVVVAAP